MYRVTKVRYLRKSQETTNHPERPDLRREMRYAYNAVGNLLQRSTTDGSGVQNPGGEFYEKWLNTSATSPGPGGDGIAAPTNRGGPHRG